MHALAAWNTSEPSVASRTPIHAGGHAALYVARVQRPPPSNASGQIEPTNGKEQADTKFATQRHRNPSPACGCHPLRTVSHPLSKMANSTLTKRLHISPSPACKHLPEWQNVYGRRWPTKKMAMVITSKKKHVR